MSNDSAKSLLEQEAYALRARLEAVKPFSMHMPMVMAAAVSPAAMSAIERHLQRHGRALRVLIAKFLRWLNGSDGRRAPPSSAQRKLTALRLRFSSVLTQFDIFAEALTQRSEHDYGVWLAGLDVLAEDALKVGGVPMTLPPMMCYLQRGLGAAIRRVNTRLPGGAKSPVTIIRVPRERMIGSAIASSIVHEVGHQAAALLDLTRLVQPTFRRRAEARGADSATWSLLEKWVSEMVADFWSVGMVGVTGTLGILAVVSLPRPFVFRITPNDPHPPPWLRVKLSCAMGDLLYPSSQWSQIADDWERLYPRSDLKRELSQTFNRLEAVIPEAVEVLADQRVPRLGGQSLWEVMPIDERQPDQLRARFKVWKDNPNLINTDRPTLAFAVLGQAKYDGRLGPQDESRLLHASLKHWAFNRAIDTGARCARAISQTDRGVGQGIQ